MAPRFAFHASKFRNVECKQLPREQSYDGLQVTTALVEGNALAATTDKFAFAHQMDGGGAIQVKLLSETGKGASTTPPLIRAHQQRVNSMEFSPFDPSVLASASADATVKIWRLPASGVLDADLTAPAATLASESRSSVGGAKFHPTAQGVVAFYAHKEVQVSDVEAQTALFQLFREPDAAVGDNVCSLAWSYDGSTLLSTSLDKLVRLVDPRAGNHAAQQTEAHSGRRQSSVVWCGRLAHFVTTGSDRMQERELKLWDPRNLSKHVHRQRLDSSIGQLFPLYDDDVNLLYLLGKGDRSVRSFEVDFSRGPGAVQALDHSVLANMTFAAAMLPKQACDAASCEVARVLNLSASGGGVCDVLSFQVPRKDAVHTFQSDLFPDTKAFAAALRADEWTSGQNAEPVLERVDPTSAKRAAVATDNGTSAVFGASSWSPPTAAPAATPATSSSGVSKLAAWGAAWNASAPPLASTAAAAPQSLEKAPAPSAPSGWGASTTAWSSAPAQVAKPAQAEPAWKATASVPTQVPQWQQTMPLVPEPVASATSSLPSVSPSEAADEGPDAGLSDKAQRLGSKYGHKFKYIAGKQATRNEVFHFGDRTVASSTIASPIIKASAQFWAVPLTGAGGPVMVSPLDASGRASSATTVLNGHRFAVTDMDFSPFDSNVLATGAGDSVIQVWAVDSARSDSSSAGTDVTTPAQTLVGHTKGVRSVQFHPTASNVLASTALDLTVRLWDVECGKEQVALTNKLEDMVWNMAFSADGRLLATSSREKIVRIFDPRRQDHALVAMGCGYDSPKPQFVTWVGDSTLLTLGVNARNEKQLVFWDAANLVEPLGRPVTVETSASSVVHYPLYDASSRLLFLVGMGDRHVQSYEIDPVAATAQANLPFAYAGTDPLSGAALLPKTLCDVRSVEVDRLLLLTPNVVDRVSFALPRAAKLRAFFQDDVYGPVAAAQAALGARAWFGGENAAPVLTSLQPSDMVPLSQKPEETAPARPKTLDFQERIRREDAEKRAKAEQFERLNALAAQPSLHAVTKGRAVTSTSSSATAIAADSDSDDDWDD